MLSRGYKALAATYSGTSCSLSVPSTSVEGMTSLTLWAKLSSGQGDLTAVFEDENGTELVEPFSVSVQSSYRQLKVTVPEQAVRLTGIRLSQATADSTLYLDHILLSEDPVDYTMRRRSRSLTAKQLSTRVNPPISPPRLHRIAEPIRYEPIRCVPILMGNCLRQPIIPLRQPLMSRPMRSRQGPT